VFGLTLAGVPLLCKSEGRFEPRSADEIGTLIGQAYPGFSSSESLRSGLAAVAVALNGGDVSKAMIVALHLRLPELDPAGAARIAHVDDALSKYDPNEPRDRRGRWTAGGGSSRSSPAPSVGVQAKPPASRRAARGVETRPEGARPAAVGVISSASDIAIPNAPESAPAKLRFAPSLQKEFDALWAQSFPGGKPREQGADVVSREDGTLEIQNIGGLGRGENGFSPDLRLEDPMDYGLIGVFHTHPYEHGVTGGSLSGQDAGELINGRFNFVMAQSGDAQFLMLKTRRSLPRADPYDLFIKQNVRAAELQARGVSFARATSIAARETAQRLGLAYYEGTHGALRRVHP
jgi:hypothetical protein